MEIGKASMAQFLVLGLEIPEDNPDRNRSRPLRLGTVVRSLLSPLRRGRIAASWVGRASRVRTSNDPSVKVCFCPAASDSEVAALSCFQGLGASQEKANEKRGS